MSRSLPSIGIIFSLGIVGCAGLGVQHNSSLRAEYGAERGLDELWRLSQDPALPGAEAPLYAEQELGSLWEVRRERPLGVADGSYSATRGGDLWNPASVTRSWEPHTPSRSRAYRLSKSAATPRF